MTTEGGGGGGRRGGLRGVVSLKILSELESGWMYGNGIEYTFSSFIVHKTGQDTINPPDSIMTGH